MPLSLKTWLYFAAMAAIALLILWLFWFFFSSKFYERQRERLIGIGDELISLDYANPQSFRQLEQTAKTQNMNIYVFRITSDIPMSGDKYVFPEKCSAEYYTPVGQIQRNENNSVQQTLGWTDERIDAYLRNITQLGDEGAFDYIESSADSDVDIIIYGGKMNYGVPSYLCLISTISKSNFATSFMRNMLIVASVVILGSSIIFAFIFSDRISRPINKLTQKANRLASGDYDVNFESNSFAEIKELAASFNFAKDEMRRTEQMRRDFIANVSHDLRTPLTMIKAYAEMVRDLSGNNPEKRTKHCQIIIDESNRLSNLVGDIQNLSKLQSGTDAFVVKPFDLSELCLTVIQRFGIMQEAQGYKLVGDCVKNALCLGDYAKIEQVLYNLIGNAINYTGEDKSVSIKCFAVEGGYKVEISDTGKGIDPSEIDFVWERYYRANQKKRNVVGSGLGLNIVKKILEGHSAKFGVDSTPGEGTTFWFILPPAPPEEE